VDSYIVRIYRQEKNNPRKLVGVVEEVGVKGKRAFTNIDDLWEILSASKGGEEVILKSGKNKTAVSCVADH